MVSSAERRTCERISASIDVRFYFARIFHSGTVTNLSEKGIFIRTAKCLPKGSPIQLLIRKEDGILTETGRIRHLIKTGDVHSGAGVELVNPSHDYLSFIKGKLNWSCKST